MAPPTPPIPPDPPAHDRDRQPDVDQAAVRTPGVARHLSGIDRLNVADVGMVSATAIRSDDAGRLPVDEVPFAWQHGRRLLLLDEERRGWTVAELRFDTVACRYVEVWRATFGWPREAAGSLLARGVVFGAEPLRRLAGAFDCWFLAHRSSGRVDDSGGAGSA